MVKVKQNTGTTMEHGGSSETVYTEVEHAEGANAHDEDGHLVVANSGGSQIAGYAPGHWASFTIES